ncbi:MAG: glycoside hydrolase family 30 protein, partial [Rhodoferax sp.]
MSVWVTHGDKSRLLARQDGVAFAAVPVLAQNIDVDASLRYQEMVGFGASLTDASAWLMTKRMSAAQRSALLQELFGRDEAGIGFELTRLTIGASDFSRSHYTFDDLPAGATDMSLERFSIAAQREDVLPVMQQALAINPQLKTMASPWSAPAWMKTSNSLVKGTLKPEMYGVFADYLIRYVEAFAAEGVPIFALTVQNEPHFEPEDYPGMRLDPVMRARLDGQFLGPRLRSRGLATQIIDWDHNWDQPTAPLAVLADRFASPYVSGVGWHCYAGNVETQLAVHEAFPAKDAWFTECSGGEWKTNWAETLPWMVRNIVIG